MKVKITALSLYPIMEVHRMDANPNSTTLREGQPKEFEIPDHIVAEIDKVMERYNKMQHYLKQFYFGEEKNG